MTTSPIFVTIEFRSNPHYDKHPSHTARRSSVVRLRHSSNQTHSPDQTVSQTSGDFHGHNGSAQRRHGQLVPVPDVRLRCHHHLEGERNSSVRDTRTGG